MYRDKQQWWYMSKQLEGNVYCCNTAGGMITNRMVLPMGNGGVVEEMAAIRFEYV